MSKEVWPPRELEDEEKLIDYSWCIECGYQLYKYAKDNDTWYAAVIDPHGKCGNGFCPPRKDAVIAEGKFTPHTPVDALTRLVIEQDATAADPTV